MNYQEFLNLSDYQLTKFVQDASTRAYYRVVGKFEQTYILMHDTTLSNKTKEFVIIADFLRENGINTPKIIKQDIDKGLLLLEDFGDETFTKILSEKNEMELYTQAINTLIKAKNIKKPSWISELTPEIIVNNSAFFIDHYYLFIYGKKISPKKREEFLSIIKNLAHIGFNVPKGFVFWDFHVDNIMRLKQNQCGVLDFQDGMWAPISYDIMSLLEDARRKVAPKVVKAMKNAFYETVQSSITRKHFDDSYAFFAIYRHMRVLGRFAYLVGEVKKTKYQKFMPHVVSMLKKHLKNKKFEVLKNWFDDNISLDINSAFILAAGRGTRMLDLCDNLPKSLIKIADKPLIEYKFENLKKSNIKDVVVNVCYQADKIVNFLRTQQKDFNIQISHEKEALETGGGIKNALNLIGKHPFFVLNSDTVFIDKGRANTLNKMIKKWDSSKYDVLILLSSQSDIIGDFGRDYKILSDDSLERNVFKKNRGFKYMFAGASIVNPKMFIKIKKKKFTLIDVFDVAMKNKRLGYVIGKSKLLHVGTPDALKKAEIYLKSY